MFRVCALTFNLLSLGGWRLLFTYFKAKFKTLLLCIGCCTFMLNWKYVSTILDWLRPKKVFQCAYLSVYHPPGYFWKRQLCEKSAVCAKMPPLDWQSLNNGLRFWPYLVTEGGIWKKDHLSEWGCAVLTPFFILPFMLMPNISCLSSSIQRFAKVISLLPSFLPVTLLRSNSKFIWYIWAQKMKINLS